MWLALLAIYIFFVPVALRYWFRKEVIAFPKNHANWEVESQAHMKKLGYTADEYKYYLRQESRIEEPTFNWFGIWFCAIVWPIYVSVWSAHRLFKATIFAPTSEQKAAIAKQEYEEALKVLDEGQ